MKELLMKAVEFEREGHREYRELARCTGSVLGRQLFETLAAEEMDHVRRIEDIYNRLVGTGGQLNPSPRRKLEDRMRESFEDLTCRHRDIDNVEGLELAMDRERRALAMYREMMDRVDDPAAREFVAKLLAEEWEHLEALKNVHFYLTSTGQWFDGEEIRRWNWMNT